MCAWRLLLLAALPALVGVGAGEVVEAGPAFLPTRRSLNVAPGEEAVLSCRIARLGDKAVSWVRARDLQILAHDGAVFSADPRVAVGVRTERGVVTHTLRLARLRESDGGRYECQLNTDPKLSQIYNLTVTDRAWRSIEVEPLGPTRILAATGSTATLGCSARLRPAEAPDPPSLRVVWYQDGQPLLPQGGVSLDTERAPGLVTSRLTLGGLMPIHSGRYFCRVTADLEEDTDPFTEDVMKGEMVFTLVVTDSVGEMEAMQRDQSPAPSTAAVLHSVSAVAALSVFFVLTMCC
ncbi:hemicentin-2-like [Leguminivora glycinivorella]|uniref:hemicentin-2-like n=1 Tax=Leguminivora glycinivorella TaxID=1035111 RepID=UPI00200D6053|nr:hemicentin-2-like [Leguminivora glycinivorella]